MILMDIRIDNFYSFKDFHMNMSYPKRIVDSPVEGEYLEDRPNFRYKKINIIMGGNATGKTSLGKMINLFANYCNDELPGRFFGLVNDPEKPAALQVDFVTRDNQLYRCRLEVAPEEQEERPEERVRVRTVCTPIGPRDRYETCAERLDQGVDVRKVDSLLLVDTRGWYFTYPADANKNKQYYSIENSADYLKILENILLTLDPSIKKVIKVKNVKNTYAIKYEHFEVLIQDGKIVDTDRLSSGTKAGIDISYIIASILCNKHSLYYCDERFSFVNSDVEKTCLSLMIQKLTGKKQLFFTTHNTDILDMQLPKHSFIFLKKDIKNIREPIRCVYASDYLKRNTDSLKCAVENDLFSAAPDLERLYEIEEM